MKSPHPGYIYVVQLGELPLIKIGYSRDPTLRAQQLQDGAGGLPMKLLAYFVGSRSAEASLHEHFSELRHPGSREWFRVEGAIVGWLDAMGLRPVNPDPPMWSFQAPADVDAAPAAIVVSALRHYEAWFSERVTLQGGAKVLASAFFADFNAYCSERGLQPTLTQRAFGGALQRSGVLRAGKDVDGRVLRLGAVLRAERE